MLANLTIKNLATVESLEIDFGPGLNTVTGETGTGKSVILGAVQIVLGERAEKTLIRQGREQCEITACFDLNHCPPPLRDGIEELLEHGGLPAGEDGELLLRRVVTPAASRCYVNAVPTPLRVMKELGDRLVDIHGPHDHQSLLSRACQLSLLDTFAGHKDMLDRCSDRWNAIRQRETNLRALEADNPSPAECEFLRHQLDEIDRAALNSDEEDELVEKHRLASHSRRLMELAGTTADGLCEADGSIVDALAAPIRSLQEMADIGGERAMRFAAELEAVVETIQDLAHDLTGFAESVDCDAEAFAVMEDRLALIHELKRKYRGDIQTILDQAEDMRRRLETAENREAAIRAAGQALAAARSEHQAVCRQLHQNRTEQATALARKISGKLTALGFASNRFVIDIHTVACGPTGEDRVEFMFAPNPGQPLMPLKKIASSGEMARVMLAVKTVLAAADPVPLLIFDEVDSNVGGRVADRVAEELASVAHDHQVLCITHLPQIAAVGSTHFQVGKRVVDNTTLTSMTRLTPNERVDELVRMMGGADSANARAHAEEMLTPTKNT
ncbi:MAG: DNA repair protein RecN [Lentisphaeria bacterium]|nr:DNA repair protein RecN [Lentisphaeria bacterium]